MIICPYCAAENIEGVDECEDCGQSLSDLYLDGPLSAVERSLVTDRIESLQPRTPVTVSTDTPVHDVLRLLVDKQIGSVIVVDGTTPVGIFSERDALLKLNADSDRLGGHPVSEFMTTNPEKLTATAKIAFAVHQMDLGSYRHIPIMDEQQGLTGIISVRDILRYLTEKMTTFETTA